MASPITGERTMTAMVNKVVRFLIPMSGTLLLPLDILMHGGRHGNGNSQYQDRRRPWAAEHATDRGGALLRWIISDRSSRRRGPGHGRTCRVHRPVGHGPRQPRSGRGWDEAGNRRGAWMGRPLPETFGRYRILRPLGAGGMGAVYLARDTQLDRLVALKVPRLGGDDRPTPGDLERFLREARAAAALLHPNLCPIFDVGEVDGT